MQFSSLVSIAAAIVATAAAPVFLPKPEGEFQAEAGFTGSLGDIHTGFGIGGEIGIGGESQAPAPQPTIAKKSVISDAHDQVQQDVKDAVDTLGFPLTEGDKVLHQLTEPKRSVISDAHDQVQQDAKDVVDTLAFPLTEGDKVVHQLTSP